jgi:phosphoribosylglycinamide formyltransferase-1
MSRSGGAADRDGIVVLISGRGSNALAIIDAASGEWFPARVRAVVADRNAPGIERAAARGAETACVPRTAFADRRQFEDALAEVLDGFRPVLIALAGFMQVLSAGFVERYRGQMVNIHPSLLPRHRGLNTHARALAAGDRVHGASVHWVTPELDAGPVVAQARVPVRAGDTEARLAQRVLEQEHRLYPAALALLRTNPVTYSHDKPLDHSPVLDRDLDDRGRVDRSC